MQTLTVEEKEKLANWEDAAGLEPVAEQELFMDSHGCNVVLMVCKQADQSLVGFTFRYSSEERFYDDDPMETFAIESEQVTETRYKRADGEDWDL